MNNNTFCVIMAGGIGTRFWPMSRKHTPKQFLDILGTGKSFIRATFERFLPLVPIENFMVVTNSAYKNLVLEHIPELDESQVLCEPIRRNTAPCIAYAAYTLQKSNPNAKMIVTPSDHLILNEVDFHTIINECLEYAESNDALMTVGIRPSRAETGYGYIQKSNNDLISRVKCFTEKPHLELAQTFVECGEFFWNSGIFIWNVSTIVESIRSYVPDLAQKMDRMAESFGTPAETDKVAEIFPTCEKISIDYAVMEKADYIYTIPGDFGWSDVGTWGSLWTLLPHDEDGNAVVGENVHLYGCKGCIVHAPGASSVVLEGLEDSIVVERDGRLLVCRLSEEQRIKDFVK